MFGVFSHDGPICKDKNGIYCAVTITEQMLERYLPYSEKLYIVTRVKKIEKTFLEAHLKPIVSDRFVIIEIGNILSPVGLITKFRYKKTIKAIVNKCSLFFLRINGVISDMIAKECRRQKKKYLVEIGGCAWDAYWNHGFLGKLVAPYMFFKTRKTVKHASYASYVTKEWLQHRYPCSCPSIVASNVYLFGFDNNLLRLKSERIKNLDKNKNITIGTIANVDVRYKGQEYVIRALSILEQSGYHCTYELVGGGDSSFLSRLASKYNVEKNIVFKGVLTHEDVAKWLEDVDIYVQPSKQEGLPRSLIEAMSKCCVCLGSTTAGIPELVEKDLLFKASDWRKIASLIEMIINDTSTKNISRITNTYIKSKEYRLEKIDSFRNAFYLEYAEKTKGEDA